MIEVIKPGISTTVQDLGRPGYYHLGFPQSGAMDRLALRSANLLVGNDEGAAGLEATFMGPEMRFERDAVIAVTGATLPILLDGAEQPGWTALAVRAGQVLSFGYLKAGARLYRHRRRRRGAAGAGQPFDLPGRADGRLRGTGAQGR